MSTSPDDIARIEWHAVRAWPAPVTQEAGGWLLRHTPGMKRLRASGAALPLASVTRPHSSLQLVEAFYADRGVPAAVQVSPARNHTELDHQLAERRYRFRAPIQVLTARSDVPAKPARDSVWDVELSDNPTAAWLGAFAELDGDDDSVHIAERVISKISLPRGFACVRVDNRVAGVGLVVGGDARWAGIYCMATHPDFRRQGVGRAVLRGGAQWALDHGAANLYLQVEQANVAAQAVYSRAGFSHAYDYHYRVAQPPAHA